MKKISKKSKVSKTISHSVKAELKVFGKVYKSDGKDIMDAIKKIELKLSHPKTSSILTIKQIDKERSRVLLPSQTFRLFSPSPLMREVAIKQISQLF